uniref:Uncharacterized protein n=1 Tax=Anguilla anguilla TaxID=7936 RepID=A0A0E9S5C2_ANGAN
MCTDIGTSTSKL